MTESIKFLKACKLLKNANPFMLGALACNLIDVCCEELDFTIEEFMDNIYHPGHEYIENSDEFKTKSASKEFRMADYDKEIARLKSKDGGYQE